MHVNTESNGWIFSVPLSESTAAEGGYALPPSFSCVQNSTKELPVELLFCTSVMSLVSPPPSLLILKQPHKE